MDEILPAVAQGAIGIEHHQDNVLIRDMLAAIADKDTATRLTAERAFLEALDGFVPNPDCRLGHAGRGSTYLTRGKILRTDGSDQVSGVITGAAIEGPALGRKLAAELLEKSGGGFFFNSPLVCVHSGKTNCCPCTLNSAIICCPMCA